MPDSEFDTDRINALNSVYDSSKQRIEYQVQLMQDLDNKALRTLRIVLLVSGLFVTGLTTGELGTIFTPNSTVHLIVGVFSLAISLVGFGTTVLASLLAARVSPVNIGPPVEDIDSVLEGGHGEKEWLIMAVDRQSEYIEENNRLLREDYTHMRYSQIGFIIMIVFLFGTVLALL